MSKNRNRAKCNKSLNSREYRLKMFREEYSYCLICNKRSGSFYYDCSPSNIQAKHRHGNGRAIFPHKYRSYKTWKHNRLTQWK